MTLKKSEKVLAVVTGCLIVVAITMYLPQPEEKQAVPQPPEEPSKTTSSPTSEARTKPAEPPPTTQSSQELPMKEHTMAAMLGDRAEPEKATQPQPKSATDETADMKPEVPQPSKTTSTDESGVSLVDVVPQDDSRPTNRGPVEVQGIPGEPPHSLTPDPFVKFPREKPKPPPEREQGPQEKFFGTSNTVTLQGVLPSGKTPIAIINDRILIVGDSIFDAEVSSILEDRVIFRKDDRVFVVQFEE